jgi:uncharacterized membrane protein
MKKQLVPVLITIFLVSAYAILQGSPTNAASHVDTTSRTAISYSNDVQPILETRCARCHIGTNTSADLHMESYARLMTGSENGQVIVPGNAADSLLAQKIVQGEMPERGPKLTPRQVQIIIDWINAGAQDN